MHDMANMAIFAHGFLMQKILKRLYSTNIKNWVQYIRKVDYSIFFTCFFCKSMKCELSGETSPIILLLKGCLVRV